MQPGGTILLDDGLIGLTVEKVEGTDIVCRVDQRRHGLRPARASTCPASRLSMPYLSAKDEEDLLFGIQEGFDFIAASFVRSAEDVHADRAAFWTTRPEADIQHHRQN